MPTPGEHKTVQARILGYAKAIGWTFVTRDEAEQRRGFDPDVPPADRAKNRSLFFDDLLDAKLREFNPRYAEAEGALLGRFRHLHANIYGNRGRLMNQAAHIAMNCDKARQSQTNRHLVRLD
ncbi:MAG: hypothetical protein KBH41_18205 [Azonexus sp.]|nr:hypothetical protein [Nitrospira sp.]MBP8789360.1 hypothetical protein [Azonexus sp.]